MFLESLESLWGIQNRGKKVWKLEDQKRYVFKRNNKVHGPEHARVHQTRPRSLETQPRLSWPCSEGSWPCFEWFGRVWVVFYRIWSYLPSIFIPSHSLDFTTIPFHFLTLKHFEFMFFYAIELSIQRHIISFLLIVLFCFVSITCVLVVFFCKDLILVWWNPREQSSRSIHFQGSPKTFCFLFFTSLFLLINACFILCIGDNAPFKCGVGALKFLIKFLILWLWDVCYVIMQMDSIFENL